MLVSQAFRLQTYWKWVDGKQTGQREERHDNIELHTRQGPRRGRHGSARGTWRALRINESEPEQRSFTRRLTTSQVLLQALCTCCPMWFTAGLCDTGIILAWETRDTGLEGLRSPGERAAELGPKSLPTWPHYATQLSTQAATRRGVIWSYLHFRGLTLVMI